MMIMFKMFLNVLLTFFVNLLTAIIGEKFVAKLIFKLFEALASLTRTDTDDGIVKDMQEAYYTYMEKKTNEYR